MSKTEPSLSRNAWQHVRQLMLCPALSKPLDVCSRLPQHSNSLLDLTRAGCSPRPGVITCLCKGLRSRQQALQGLVVLVQCCPDACHLISVCCHCILCLFRLRVAVNDGLFPLICRSSSNTTCDAQLMCCSFWPLTQRQQTRYTSCGAAAHLHVWLDARRKVVQACCVPEGSVRV